MISDRHLRILGQYSALERIPLALAARFSHYRGVLISYVESKQVFEYALDHGFSLERCGKTSVLRFDDPEIGPCCVTLRRRTSDFVVFSQCFCSRQYAFLVRLIRLCWPDGGIRTIVDAGANIGLSALYLGRCFPDARVVCIEADEGNHRQCLENLRANGLRSMAVSHAALWSESARVRTVRGFRDGRDWAIQVAPLARGHDGNTVEGLTMADFLERHQVDQVDLLKMDIEGTEKLLFADEREVKRWLPRAKCLALEIHDREGEAQILPLLEEHGFFAFQRGELTIAIPRAVVSPQRLLEFFSAQPLRSPSTQDPRYASNPTSASSLRHLHSNPPRRE